MKITIIGTGYVGLVTGACLAQLGNHVVCLDVDQRKIQMLNDGGIPIHEPGLDVLVAENRAAGRLQFTSNIAEGVAHGQLQFIAVGTPPDEDGSADLQYVLAAARNIAAPRDEFQVGVNKSTVPVGTGDKVRDAINEVLQQRKVNHEFAVVSNPEFLKEGAAVEDFTHPDRIVIGCDTSASGQRAQQLMRNLYGPFQRDHDCICWMDVRSAELTKYAANAMLASRISFMNELARLADVVGADIEAVRHGIGSDKRIGPSFLYAGCGYGGSCFPKDVQALARTGQELGLELKILRAVEEVNDLQKQVLPNKIFARFGENLQGMRFALWG
ncbi:MAG: UDP-glucose/GDP-mannose dehydrogenase family protein, partial [Burkholderiales bacterium]|nr:UDP-glucose/GDP-mannose dehydrogenase family protein [Burkholderiales bacterium]